MSNVSVGFSAQPNQILDAYRKIEEAGRRANKELRSMRDIDFPGLEDAREELEAINRGFTQMFSKVVRGTQAEALRSGARGGVYDRDLISWLRNARRQFPDESAYQRHVHGVLRQAGNLSSLAQTWPGAGGGAGSAPHPGGGGGGGAGLGGLVSMMPMARALKLGLGVLGVGTGMGAISRQIGAAEEESVGMTDLRRNVWGLNEAFAEFRDTVRKTGEGLGVTFNEALRYARTYASLSGAMSSAATYGGTREGLRMARLFGMDPSQGVGMLGRASWLGVGGASPKEQARLLADAMASSNLGGRQADAAEAMLRFAERNAGVLGDAGNVAGFRSLYTALVNSGHAGIRANAAGILGGYDEAVRAGGHAGDAGKNFIYNAMARHGVRDIFDIQYALEGGFTGTLANGHMIGPELIKALRQRYSSNNKMLLSAMSNLLGGSMHHAQGALEAFDTYREDPAALKAAIAKLEADLKQGDTGTQVRQASADLQNVLQDLLGTRLLPIASASKDFLATIAGGVNSALDYMVPGHRRERERRENMAAWELTAMQKAAGKYAGSMEHAPALFGHQVGDAQLAELKALNEKRALMQTMRSADYGKFQRLLELQHGLPAGTLRGIAMAESSNGANLVSNVGALGPYQLMSKTAAMLGVKNPMDPYESATGAAKYLKDIRARHPDWEFANVLSAYHSGEGNVGSLGPRGRAYAPTVMGHMAGAGEVSVLLRSEVVVKDPRGNVLGSVKNPPTRVTAPSGRAAQQ